VATFKRDAEKCATRIHQEVLEFHFSDVSPVSPLDFPGVHRISTLAQAMTTSVASLAAEAAAPSGARPKLRRRWRAVEA